jgi:hypothetical protein
MQHRCRMTILLVAGGIVILVVALVVGVGIKLFDLSGCREDDAERLQDRMTERLRSAVGEVPLTIVANASGSSREPVVIEIAGPVATVEARERVLRQARFEASRLGRDVRVADRLEVRNVTGRPAA